MSKEKYNIIILAGGLGSRMGEQSEYLPKALTPMGELRAIDWIIYRYTNIAHKFVIGTYFHGDLLESYVRGKYPHLSVEFSREADLKSNLKSFALCLDHTDTAYPTLVTFCDLIMIGNFAVKGDTIYLATENTKGVVGTFRHTLNNYVLEQHGTPVSVKEGAGVVGTFVFQRTAKIKEIVYSLWDTLDERDITWDACTRYFENHFRSEEVDGIVEFGTGDELKKARALWERI